VWINKELIRTIAPYIIKLTDQIFSLLAQADTRPTVMIWKANIYHPNFSVLNIVDDEVALSISYPKYGKNIGTIR